MKYFLVTCNPVPGARIDENKTVIIDSLYYGSLPIEKSISDFSAGIDFNHDQYLVMASDTNFNTMPPCKECGKTPTGIIELMLYQFLMLRDSFKMPVHTL